MASIWIWAIILAIISFFKGHDLGIFMILIVGINLLYSLYSVWKYYRRYQQALKILPYLHNTPFATEDKLDCYVKFVGTLLNANNLQAPLTHKACNLFFTRQWGVWQAKRKKPQKGHETAKKTLTTLVSSDILLIKSHNTIITLEPQNFLPNALLLMPETKLEFTEPAFAVTALGKIHPYKTYEVIEYMTQQQTKVLILGKLVRKNNQLLLMPTFTKQHPSIFCVGDFAYIDDFVQDNVMSLYKHVKLHVFIPPLINVLTLSYLILQQITQH